jgi:hypothetical protein
MTSKISTDDLWERRWGIPAWEPDDMTICLAAICDNGNAIVVASDREVGVGFTSTELDRAKVGPLFNDWHHAIAGTVHHATEVIIEATRMEKSLPSLASFDVKTALEKAYQKVRMAKIEATILASRGWNLADFQQYGTQRLSPGIYSGIDTQMSLYDLRADLLVFGFGTDGVSIITIGNPGVGIDHWRLGFWCIGSGSTLAQASMFSRDYSAAWSIEKAAYTVYEAKRIAERATGVGDNHTDVIVVRPSKKVTVLPDETKQLLEKTYEKLKPRELSAAQWHDLTGAFAKL